jgi:hypothetical protein
MRTVSVARRNAVKAKTQAITTAWEVNAQLSWNPGVRRATNPERDVEQGN